MMIGARTTDRMCRPMMRASLDPATRAASTNSSCRTPTTARSMSRKNAGARSTPKTAMANHSDGPSTARAASRTTMPGSA